MTLKKITWTLFFLILCCKIQAQNFELGKVSVAELQEKEHPLEPAAPAAILFEKGKNYFEYTSDKGFTMATEVKVRIKIYKKEGNDWATKKIQYYSASNGRETLSFSDAVTYNLVGDKIEKTKLKSDGEFTEELNKYWSQKKITMPNVKEGSVIEYKYVIRSPRVGSCRDWFFQNSIPVNYSEYKNTVPEYFEYNANIKGFLRPKVEVQKGSNYIELGSARQGAQNKWDKEKLSYVETTTIYSFQNVPAVKEEAYVNNIENYTSTLVQELAITKYPGEPFKSFSTNWEAVVKTIYDYDDFGPELNKSGYFEDDLKLVLKDAKSEEDKIKSIFKFVQSTIKWNEYNGYSCNDGVKKAYKDKTGNVAEINLMLTAMLRHAGLEANPVLVSTRSNGVALFPSRTAFNYVIVAVQQGKDLMLLDAADPFSVANVLPVRDLNWLGRLIKKDGTSLEIDLMPKQLSVDYISMNYSIDAEGQVAGKLRRQRTDHNAMSYRGSVKGVKEDAYLEKFEEDNNNIEVNDYVRTNENDLDAPVIESMSFKGSNFTEKIGNTLYVKPLLFFTILSNPFKQETREYPVDFAYGFLDKFTINIQIPEGYKVESFPESAAMSMENELASFKFLINVSGSTLQISFNSQMNSPILGSEYYPALKMYFQKMIDKQNEKIILVKL